MKINTEEQWWIFTWGFGQGFDNCYTRIFGTFQSARDEMCRRFGYRWGFQYGSDEEAGVEKYNLKLIK
jgi:hypothetical protein